MDGKNIPLQRDITTFDPNGNVSWRFSTNLPLPNTNVPVGVTLLVTDAQGNKSKPKIIIINRNPNLPPRLTVESPRELALNIPLVIQPDTKSITLTGFIEDDAAGAQLLLNGIALDLAPEATTDRIYPCRWRFTREVTSLPKPGEAREITLMAIDAAGAKSEWKGTLRSVKPPPNLPPTITIDGPAALAQGQVMSLPDANAPRTITGTITDDADGVRFTFGASALTLTPMKSTDPARPFCWRFTEILPLPDEGKGLTAALTATDADGLTAIWTGKLQRLKNLPPHITIDSPEKLKASGQTLETDAPVLLTGVVTDDAPGVIVMLDNAEVPLTRELADAAARKYSWSFKATLPLLREGELHAYALTAIDAVGEQVRWTGSLHRPAPPPKVNVRPQITITGGPEALKQGKTFDVPSDMKTLSLQGVVTDDSDGVILYLDGERIPLRRTAGAANTVSYQFTVTLPLPKADETLTVSLIADDALGQRATWSGALHGVKAPPLPVLDLAVLVSKAKSGETIELPDGEYKLAQPLIIKKSLTLKAKPGAKVVVTSDTPGCVVSFDGKFTWTLENITFQHTGNAPADVVRVKSGTVSILRCIFAGAPQKAGTGGIGLLVEDTLGKITDSTFERNSLFGILFIHRVNKPMPELKNPTFSENGENVKIREKPAGPKIL